MVKDSNEELAHPEYWDQRYSAGDDDAKAYDWLRRFDTIKPFMMEHLPAPGANAKVLHLGSGNSVSLVEHGSYQHQTG
jgi:EEF1A lysine methyltransferase 4